MCTCTSNTILHRFNIKSEIVLPHFHKSWILHWSRYVTSYSALIETQCTHNVTITNNTANTHSDQFDNVWIHRVMHWTFYDEGCGLTVSSVSYQDSGLKWSQNSDHPRFHAVERRKTLEHQNVIAGIILVWPFLKTSHTFAVSLFLCNLFLSFYDCKWKIDLQRRKCEANTEPTLVN